MQRFRPVVALSLVALLALGVTPHAAADSGVAAAGPAKPLGGTRSIHDLFGVPVAKRLLRSDNTDDRVRGVERLGSLGTDEAIEALVHAIEGGGTAPSDTMVRLSAVRVLAAHTDKEPALQVLVRELTTPVGPEAQGTVKPLQSLLRETAALALARAGTKKATAPLLSAVERGGPAREAAQKALRAYPPTSIESFFQGKKKLAVSHIAFLGDLGDLRAIEKLRPLLKEGETDAKLAAVVALAKLGDETALATVRPWLKRGDPRLLKAAAEVLIRLGAREASPAVAALLASDITRRTGLQLALFSPTKALVEPLTGALEKLSEDDRPRAIAAIGRAGGPAAVKALVAEIEKTFGGKASGGESKSDEKSAKNNENTPVGEAPAGLGELAMGALFAIATMPGDDAHAALEKLLSDSRASKEDAIGRAIVRAAIVRVIVRRATVTGLDGRLRAWLGSKQSASRAVGALGLVATGAKSAEEMIAACTEKKCDEAIFHAAARGALARGSKEVLPFLSLLEKSWGRGADLAKPKAIAISAGVGLLADPSGRGVPTSTLAAWAESGGPLSPLASRALPSRDDDVTRGRIERLLEGTDPVVRAHVALGLGRDPEKDAVSLLVRAYRFEADVEVRRAIVRALSERKEAQRTHTLETARALDPDEGVRALARAALSGRTLAPPPVIAQAVAWVSIQDNGAEEGESTAPRAGRVVRSDGVAVPFVADPDGMLIVPGLSHQKFDLQIDSGAKP